MKECNLFYETKYGKIYHGDCLDYLLTLEDNTFDICLTDPPYGINIAKRKIGSSSIKAKLTNHTLKYWDKKLSKEYIDNILRISKNQIIFGGNYYANWLPTSSCWIVWDKDNGNINFSDCELIYTSFNKTVRKIKYRWHGFKQEDMRNYEKRKHPTMKPKNVIGWIINKYVKNTDKVIDPFLGSGTTGLCCELNKIQWIGIEQDIEYCEIAKERFKKETKQLCLF